MTKSLILCLFLALVIVESRAQTHIKAKIKGEDTLGYAQLPTFKVVAEKQFISENVENEYYRKITLRRDVERVYPYALEAASLFEELQKEMATVNRKKDKKALIREKENALMNSFESRIKLLTEQQGQIFVKLIHRENGKSCYELLKDVKSRSSAYYWQKAAKVSGVNLKETYDPNNEDKEIERILTNKIY